MNQRQSSISMLALVCLFVVACGGGTDAVSTPTPPAPPPVAPLGPPATATVQQGSGQIGEPTTVLPIRPAVLVKDSLGRVLAGVSVLFAVDSGGGAIASGQTSTGADGVATSGSWTLGESEGRHTLRVTVGNLPSVTLAATALVADVVVGSGQTSSTGGTVTIVRPGSALNNFAITVPDSAFSTSVSFTVRQSSSAGLLLAEPGAPVASLAVASTASALRAVGRMAAASPAVTPVITIVSNGAAVANGELLLRVPVPANVANPMVAVVDSARVPRAFLPIVARDSSAVTVTTRVLDAATLRQVGNIPQPTSPPPHSLSLVIFKGPTGLPNLSTYAPSAITTGYTFGKSNFAFLAKPTMYTSRIDIGMMLVEYAAGAYFPAGVYHAFDRAPGVRNSDTRGITTTAAISTHAALAMGRYGAAWIAVFQAGYPRYDYEIAAAVLNTLSYTRQPVPLWLSNGTYLYMVLVTGWDPANERFIVRDANFGAPGFLSFKGGKMSPYADPIVPSVQYTVPYFTWSWLAGYWPTLAGYTSTLSNASAPEYFSSLFRNSRVEAWGAVAVRTAPNVPDSIFLLADTTRLWPITHSPPFPLPTTLPVPSGWGLTAANLHERTEAGVWNPERSGSGTSFRIDWSAFPNGNAETMGVEIAEYQGAGETFPAWAGWRELRLIKFGLTITAQFASSGSPSTLTPVLAATSPRLPSGAAFEWDFGDDTPKQKTSTLSPVNHTYANNGNYTVTLRVLHTARNDLPIARVTKSGAVTGGSWLITSISDPDSLFGGDIEGGGPLANLLQRLLSTPTSGIVSIDQDASNRPVLMLRVLRTFVWNPTECCPPVPRGEELTLKLGSSVPEQHNFGPHFAAWQTSSFTRTATTLTSRQAISPFIPYVVKNAGVQTGPSGGVRLNATLNGNTMSGTITFTIWFIDEDAGDIGNDSEESFRLPFTAIRMGG